MPKAASEDDAMKLPAKGRIEWNLNTLLIIGGILLGILSTGIGWGMLLSQLNSNDKETRDWQIRHEEMHRDRLRVTSEEKARSDQRIAQLEMETRKIENLTYRLTIAEQVGQNTGKAIEMLTQKMSEQQSDIRVIREILDRQFGTSTQTRRQR